MRDLVEIADYLDALSAGEGHAGNPHGSKALFLAAKLLRSRSDQDDTEPVIFLCPNCSHVFGVEPDQ